MILYTEKDLLAAYGKYVKALKDITNPPIFEVEPQDDVDIDIWDEMDNDKN